MISDIGPGEEHWTSGSTAEAPGLGGKRCPAGQKAVESLQEGP